MDRPGNYADYLRRFRSMPKWKLRELHRGLPQFGAGWRTANYRLALEQAIKEPRR